MRITYQLIHPEGFNFIREIKDRTSPTRLKKRQRRKADRGIREIRTFRYDAKRGRLYHGTNREKRWFRDSSAWITVRAPTSGVTVGEINAPEDSEARISHHFLGMLNRHFAEKVCSLQFQYR